MRTWFMQLPPWFSFSACFKFMHFAMLSSEILLSFSDFGFQSSVADSYHFFDIVIRFFLIQ